ncbi:hypothetical protein BASA60_009802 [Batrachochytrium salamandrivorans]|nr:hypothetical protein BASA60_009802 [Batrachochytrium salamandrivorans]
MSHSYTETYVGSSMGSLSTVASVFSSIVVYGAGTALTNSKTLQQGLAVAIAATAFLAQRIVFMTLVENVPGLHCDAANGASYGFLVIMRFAILWGLYMRAAGASRIYKSRTMKAFTVFATILGVTSATIVTFQGLLSEDIPGTCSHYLNKYLTALNNLAYVLSLSILTVVVSVPIFGALTGHSTLASHPLQQPSLTRVHNQARVLKRFLRLVPIVLCMLLTILSLLSSQLGNRFMFLGVLIFSDFCSIWLLLFPLVIMAGDNGDNGDVNDTSGPHSAFGSIHSQTRSLHNITSASSGAGGDLQKSSVVVSMPILEYSDLKLSTMHPNGRSPNLVSPIPSSASPLSDTYNLKRSTSHSAALHGGAAPEAGAGSSPRVWDACANPLPSAFKDSQPS